MSILVARLIRAPALHFLLLGAVLFVANGWWQARTGNGLLATDPEPIAITDSQIDQLRRELAGQIGGPPSPGQLRAAIDAAIEEEILFREALAHGLDRDNEAVRRRLIQVAGFISEDPSLDDEALYQTALKLGLDRSDTVVRRQLATMMGLVAANAPMAGERPPDDEELEAYLQQNPERFAQPWRIRFSHVYFSEDRRGATAQADARAVFEDLRARGAGPDAAADLGDPFLLGHHFNWQTGPALQRRLGQPFAAAVAELQPGAWSEPILSAYGWHLVWASDIEPAFVPDLDTVRDQVAQAVSNARREWRLEETLKAMRAGYTIELGASAPAEAGSAGGKSDG